VIGRETKNLARIFATLQSFVCKMLLQALIDGVLIPLFTLLGEIMKQLFKLLEFLVKILLDVLAFSLFVASLACPWRAPFNASEYCKVCVRVT
jgi:hypothetical protein